MSREGTKRTLTVLDDGDGIPQAMHELVFEPRVTSKLDTSHFDAWGLHGRGMALFSIAQNAECAAVKASAPGKGCAIRVVTDVKRLSEKADQSSFPTFELADAGTVNVRGPKNILRTVCEFALESRSSCKVHVGTPAEICAAVYDEGIRSLSTVERLFCTDPEELPLVKRLAVAQDPDSLATSAESMGFSFSSRTARRIIDGQIEPAPQVLDRVRIKGMGISRNRGSHRGTSSPQVRIDARDKSAIAHAAEEAFGEIARKYYLEEDVDADIRIRNDLLHIAIPLVRKQ